MTLVSVVMPSYKSRRETIYRAIISIINQTYKNWELIIIDDNNIQEYSNVLTSIISEINDNRIHYIKNKENKGSAKSRNIGIEKSKGKYITFLDDDDEYLENKIYRQLNIMLKENADYSITDLNLYDDKGKLVRKRKHCYIYQDNDLLKLHLKFHLTGTDTFMFKKEYLCKIGMFDEIDMGDEFYLMLKAIKAKGKFVYLADCDVKAYVHEAGIGLSAGTNRLNGEKLLFNEKEKYFNMLSQDDIHYIRMRHNLVLCMYYIKNKKIKFIVYISKAFLCNPGEFIKFFIKRKEY